MPPTISETTTTHGLNSTLLMKPCAKKPITIAGMKARGEVAHEQEIVGVGEHARRDPDQLGAVGPAHGEDGAELDDDLEHFARRPLEADQVDQQDQMPGRGHRNELGQPLDDAKEDGAEQSHEIHV